VALDANEVVTSFQKGPDAKEVVQEFKITSAVYDSGNHAFTITFTSPVGMNY
jgi:hypothetical protein